MKKIRIHNVLISIMIFVIIIFVVTACSSTKNSSKQNTTGSAESIDARQTTTTLYLTPEERIKKYEKDMELIRTQTTTGCNNIRKGYDNKNIDEISKASGEMAFQLDQNVRGSQWPQGETHLYYIEVIKPLVDTIILSNRQIIEQKMLHFNGFTPEGITTNILPILENIDDAIDATEYGPCRIIDGNE